MSTSATVGRPQVRSLWHLPPLQTLLVNDRPLFFRFCIGNVFSSPKSLNCSDQDCPLVEAVEEYAKQNLARVNVFFKVYISQKQKAHSSLVGCVGNTLHEGREDPKNEIFVQLWHPSLSHTWLQPSHFCGAALSFPFTTCFLSWCDKEK